MKDRANTEKGVREFVDNLRTRKILGFEDKLVPNKDLFLLAAALGEKNPRELQGSDGFFLFKDLKYDDKCKLEVMQIGTLRSDDEVDQFADLESCIPYCEKCAARGFDILREKVEAAKWNNDVLEDRLMKELDELYQKNVEEDDDL